MLISPPSSGSSSMTASQALSLTEVLRLRPPNADERRPEGSSATRADGDKENDVDVEKGNSGTGVMNEEYAMSLLFNDAFDDLVRRSERLDSTDFTPPSMRERILQELLEQLLRRPAHNGRQTADDLMDMIRGVSTVGTAASTASNEDSPVIPPVIPFLPPWGTAQADNNICMACQCEVTGKSVKLDCGSKYDIDCLKRMFEANVNDEYNFPPRCCGRPVPLSEVKEQLTKETLDLYEAKLLEYSTSCRLYCSNTNCGQFLGGRRETIVPVKCTTCDKETCGFCCASAHSASQKCKIDKGLRKALKLAQSNGWQRCPRCRQVVERDHGCFHMMCRCGAEFCYLCAADWYECRCRYRRRLFVRLVAMRWMRGNYLLKSEPGAKGHGSVTGFCKRSWKSVVKVVTPGA